MPKRDVVGKPAGHGRFRAIARRFGALRADSAGGVTVFLALSLPAIIGFAGLGTEAASWYLTKRTMQGAADTAASTAAASLAAGTTGSAILANEAKSIAAYHDFVDGSNGTTVTVNHPPSSGTYQGNSNAVEVSISRQEPALLSALFLPEGPTITARAVASADRNLTDEACVVALDKNNETAMRTTGTTDLIFPSCSLYINSPSQSALTMSGNATIQPKKAYLVGNYSTSGGSSLQPANGTYTGVDPLIDPYRNVAVPAYSGCNDTGYSLSGNKSATKNAGSAGIYVFCDGIKLSGNSSLTLGPGTYIIAGGQLSISGGSHLTATGGTTIILTARSGSCATAKISGGAIINLVAPTTGNLAGIAVYQDRQCSTDHNLTSDFSGGSTMNITGAIYFPEQSVDYSGGTATGGAQCTQLIAWKIRFTGNAVFQNNCAGTGTRKLSLTGGRLVE
ncbi:MAG: pilus assembly protein TadG-related protein [Alphaproteobacteria bacterium]